MDKLWASTRNNEPPALFPNLCVMIFQVSATYIGVFLFRFQASLLIRDNQLEYQLSVSWA
jgi:hypothetical protein